MEGDPDTMRRSMIKAAGALAAALPAMTAATVASAQSPSPQPITTLTEVREGPNTKLSVERRGQLALLGLNRPALHNRVDPETFVALARALYEIENDPTIRATVLYGHGAHFSRGIDVPAYQSVANSGGPLAGQTQIINPLGFGGGPQRRKPLIAAVHGDTWNLAHELFLSYDRMLVTGAGDQAAALG